MHPMMPTGYARLRIAVARSRAASSFEAARQLLREVAFGEEDFAWLEDVRTLALAEAAHRFGDAAAESECVAAFRSA